jgi:lysophospholipase L1-like esterase
MKKNIIITVLLAIVLLSLGFMLTKKENKKKINYIALGDSIAEGMDPYFNIIDGYTNYIRDYLDDTHQLGFYTKAFAKSSYRTMDLRYDIKTNKSVEIDGDTIYIQKALQESNLVTLTIGANDFIRTLTLDNIKEKLTDTESSMKEADEIALRIKELILLIREYAKGDIIVTGYYNPFPRLNENKEEIEDMIKYFNHKIEEVCQELNVEYVDIFDLLKDNKEALPNPFNIHPNEIGYKLIAQRVIEKIEELTK